jgi:hypothetical protein
MEYRHTQIGWVIIIGLGIPAAALLVSYLIGERTHQAELPLVVFLIVVMYLFSSLTVEVKGAALSFYFGPGLVRRKIDLASISGAHAVTNPLIMGWGIHWWPGRYWLWNVSGKQAVELVFTSGKRMRIGTDEPEKLLQAIQSVRPHREGIT